MAKKPQAQPVYRNCYIRPSAKNSESDQRVAIEASGPMTGRHAKTVVESGKKGTTPDLRDLLKTVRAGEEFVVAELQCLGDDLPAAMAVLKRVQAKGLTVVEAATGLRWTGGYDGPAAGLALGEYFRGRSLSTMKARRAGKAGAAKRYEDLHAGRVPLAEAVRRWNDAVARGAKKDEAIAAVNDGFSEYLAYRTLRNLAQNGKLPGALAPLPTGRRRST